MLLHILGWSICFFVLFVTGSIAVSIFTRGAQAKLQIDEYLIVGLSILTIISSWISILVPISLTLRISLLIAFLGLTWWKRDSVISDMRWAVSQIKSIEAPFRIFLICFIVLL